MMRRTAAATIAPHVVFGVLLAFNVFRTLHHAMWSDEIRPFLIAADSPTLVEVFHELHYEGHPGLWYVILWAITRVSADPLAMQIVHAAIGVGVWLLIYRCSPFATPEKFLLLLSYFLFWEYFVISRSYGLMALLGFGFIAVRTRRPRSGMLPWILLGLLANTVVYGAIWSLAMATFFGAERIRTDRPSVLRGAGVYATCLGFAIWTMTPAPDAVHALMVSIGVGRLASLYTFPVDALAPFPVTWLKEVCAFVIDPRTATYPTFWNPVPVHALARVLGLADPPGRVATILAAALVACWAIIRDRRVMAELAMGYVGVLLFTYVWHFRGYARHHGIVLLMLVAAVWLTRVRDARVPRRGLWWAILGVNVIAGLTTLSSEFRPFSEGRNVAAWIEQHGLADAFLVGSPDVATATVAAYLQRPIYYLESESRGRLIEENTRRQVDLGPVEIGRRVVRALAGRDDAILILNHELAPETAASTAPDLSFTPARAFTRAIVPRERYFVYRVTRRDRTASASALEEAGEIRLAGRGG